ncbi:SOS response-associated peptidase [Paenibacillus agilis]|uniref:Abasic site processing protein n=1 Tax=Paenibacillus agilis TaxID=3020863 RepID=A0A559IKS1_9BACL|nr:SOS response-associated peptidase [Paenibacillus agilis]TVX88262.1 SOS response-associated peptidase [Paenibacillus agilis]
MCRQYSLSTDYSELQSTFKLDESRIAYRPRYNIKPTQLIPIIMEQEGRRVLDAYRWGLVPFWAPDAINADLTAVAENSSYFRMVERRRCIIPCNGLYYWRKQEKRMHPVRIVLQTRGIFGIAGLYECWRSPQGDDHYNCTVVMSRANRTILEFDSRMPAILDQDEMEDWLQPSSLELDYLNRLLKPIDDERLHLYPVSPLIQYEHHDDSRCIAEMDLKRAWIKA